MSITLPFSNFSSKYAEFVDGKDYCISMTMRHLEFPTIDFTISQKFTTPVTDSDRSDFMHYFFQNVSAWLLYGEAVVNVKRPEIPLTGAFDVRRGLWYILDNKGERVYETDYRDNQKQEQEVEKSNE